MTEVPDHVVGPRGVTDHQGHDRMTARDGFDADASETVLEALGEPPQAFE
jgi:hypothetical protein